MSRYVRQKNDAFRPAPVQRINLDFKNKKLRIGFIAFFAAVAIIAFAYFGFSLLSKGAGWREIEVEPDNAYSVAPYFTVSYNLGLTEANPTAEYKAGAAIYKEAAARAYMIFDAKEEHEGYPNLATLSRHPNEPVELDPRLYEALERTDAASSRLIYLAPILEEYRNLFFCETDLEAEAFDPARSAEMDAYFREVCTYANDPEEVSLELLGQNRAVLHVSAAYLAFAEREGIETFLDLGWLRNAFAADYLADIFREAGMLFCSISSKDGYSVVLDPTDAIFATGIMDFQGTGAFRAASLLQKGPYSVVSLHDHDVYNNPEISYYRYEDGTTVSLFVDPSTGRNGTALHDLTLYSEDQSCAKIALAASDVFLADHFDEAGLLALQEKGIESVYCENFKIICSDADAQFGDLYTSNAVTYTVGKAN